MHASRVLISNGELHFPSWCKGVKYSEVTQTARYNPPLMIWYGTIPIRVFFYPMVRIWTLLLCYRMWYFDWKGWWSAFDTRQRGLYRGRVLGVFWKLLLWKTRPLSSPFLPNTAASTRWTSPIPWWDKTPPRSTRSLPTRSHSTRSLYPISFPMAAAEHSSGPCTRRRARELDRSETTAIGTKGNC